MPNDYINASSVNMFKNKIDIYMIRAGYTNKSCDFYPFPTLLLKSCSNKLIFSITTIINLLMQGGVIPWNFKQALVNPLIKKETMCKNYLKNYFQSQFSVNIFG